MSKSDAVFVLGMLCGWFGHAVAIQHDYHIAALMAIAIPFAIGFVLIDKLWKSRSPTGDGGRAD